MAVVIGMIVEMVFLDLIYDGKLAIMARLKTLSGVGTRESTPCSLIKAADTITTPGSTTKKTCSIALNQRARNELLANVPSSCELEDFFARAEQSVQRHFVEKYNFDFAKEVPLTGRYEWVAVSL
ncbi:cyclin-dependent kinase inhibitor 3 [Phtheirospermum japonicum]|uniref:Cyclin-dependent kinase inhibitor 3 n=1 Tax=Phtheirospermum japonicum TaxID=374723 RepID=A0A830DC94_9LAMI|nr:cyclin-dependent kinase inhibitor 3 [Phtheirospermum japonicum]